MLSKVMHRPTPHKIQCNFCEFFSMNEKSAHNNCRVPLISVCVCVCVCVCVIFISEGLKIAAFHRNHTSAQESLQIEIRDQSLFYKSRMSNLTCAQNLLGRCEMCLG
jgi:hypothetical protein